jgi:hypothetical protein
MRRFLPLLSILCAVAGCGGQTVSAVAPSVTARPPASIRHVVIVVQENRSFDNLFSGFPGADAPKFGYAGTARLKLRATPLENPGNIENNWRDAISGWNRGKMNGFER